MKEIKLNWRYHNGEIDDDLPYVGEIKLCPVTNKAYDEEGDVLDAETWLSFCEGAGRGSDE